MKDTERKRGRKGEGSIRLAKANAVVNAAKGIFRWEIRIPVKRPGEPSVTRSKTFVGTEHQARVERRRWQTELETSGVVRASATFGEFVAEFLAQIERRFILGTASPGTLDRYQCLAQKHIIPRWGKVKTGELNEGAVERWYESLRDPRNADLSLASVKLVHCVMLGALRLAKRAGAVPKGFLSSHKFPSARKERATPVGKAFSRAEASAWLKEARKVPTAGPLIFSLLTGVRKGEALALKWSDLDWEAGTAHIQRTRSSLRNGKYYEGAPKTAASNRIIHLSPSALTVLTEARARTSGEYVFVGAMGRPMLPSMLGRLMPRICAAAGVPRLRVHDLRHTHASFLLADGKPIAAISKHLGHSSPAVTLRIYAHALADDLKTMDIGLLEAV